MINKKIQKNVKYNSEIFSCVVIHEPKNGEYKFLIKQNCMSFMAFRTQNGFNEFLKVYDLVVIPETIQKHICLDGSEITTYRFKNKKLLEFYFWDLKEVKGFKKFIGLSNGDYVDCYYKHLKNSTIVCRANPNAKDIYIPYNYFEMAKIYG